MGGSPFPNRLLPSRLSPPQNGSIRPPLQPPGSLVYPRRRARHPKEGGLVCDLATVLHRGMGTGVMGTILEFASVPLRKMGTDLLGSWWPCQCVLPLL
jgi:hypothetical protein